MVEDQDMDGAMKKMVSMDFAPRTLSDHFILLIDHIKNLFTHHAKDARSMPGRKASVLGRRIGRTFDRLPFGRKEAACHGLRRGAAWCWCRWG